MEDLFNHPVFQGGVAPFAAGLVVALALLWTRLSGLAVVASFVTAVYLISGLTFEPLTATRKIVLLGCAAPAAGLLLDFAFEPKRFSTALVAIASGAASVWVFWSILTQKELAEALLLGGVTSVFVAAVTAIGLSLAREPVRASTAGLTLGLAVGISAMLGASALYALYGIALGAGAGAFLLLQMVLGRRIFAGATLTLPAALTSGLLAAGAMIQATLPWYALPALVFVPVAALVPLPEKMPIWQQAFLRSGCAMMAAGIAFTLTWRFAGNAIT